MSNQRASPKLVRELDAGQREVTTERGLDKLSRRCPLNLRLSAFPTWSAISLTRRRRCGPAPRDLLMVHSSLRSIGLVRGAARNSSSSVRQSCRPSRPPRHPGHVPYDSGYRAQAALANPEFVFDATRLDTDLVANGRNLRTPPAAATPRPTEQHPPRPAASPPSAELRPTTSSPPPMRRLSAWRAAGHSPMRQVFDCNGRIACSSGVPSLAQSVLTSH